MKTSIGRRQMLRGGALAAVGAALPAWAQSDAPGIAALPTLSGDDIILRIAHQMLSVDGRETHAIGINGSVPAPLLRLKEGQTARIHIENQLDEESSLH